MRKLIGTLVLSALFSGLALAQSSSASHTVTVKVPPVLALSLNATDFLFDFTVQGTGSLTVGGDTYPLATEPNYLDFLDTATTQLFAPTSVAGAGGDLFGTLSVRTNQGGWTLKLSSITGTLSAPLANNRVHVFLVKAGGPAVTIPVGTPTPIAQNLTLAQISTGGEGKRTFNLYYLLQMDAADAFPTTTYNGQITVSYLATAP